MMVEKRVVLQGREYDIYNADKLDAELQCVSGGETIVDFSNVHYLDSTALGRLIRALKQARASDTKSAIIFENVAPSIRHLLSVTGLDRVFTVR